MKLLPPASSNADDKESLSDDDDAPESSGMFQRGTIDACIQGDGGLLGAPWSSTAP